ncbi:hypothetical protein EsH8_X_000069 [Colletotrichum jinshuiense]
MQDSSAGPIPSAAPMYSPLETFLDRRHPQPISVNLGFERFRWPAFSPLHEIKVLRDSANAESEQDSYQAEDATFLLHTIASEPYTNPPISSLEASIEILNYYGSRVAWEDLHTADGPEEDTGVPCECCDRMPYRAPQPLIIRASSNPYVTIGDIVDQVSNYVNDLQEDVLEALDAVGEYAGQRSPDHSFWIDFSVNSINIEEARSREELKKAWKDTADSVRQFRPGMKYKEINQPLGG